jgi:hypothetical protein
MKTTVLIITLAAGLTLAAKPARADDPAVPAAPPVQAENSALPNANFSPSRYEALWTKSPFAVATSEAAPESPDYMLVGIANVDGISYASVIDAHNQEHFLISSDKPTRGLTLTSVTRNHDDTYAVVQKDGQPITLKLEQPPPTPVIANAPAPGAMAMPGPTSPLIPMPGANLPPPGSARPFTRMHHPLINLPPRPAEQQQPAPTQTSPPPAQAAPPPPH